MEAAKEAGVSQQMVQRRKEGQLASCVMSLMPESLTERDDFVDAMIAYFEQIIDSEDVIELMVACKVFEKLLHSNLKTRNAYMCVFLLAGLIAVSTDKEHNPKIADQRQKKKAGRLCVRMKKNSDAPLQLFQRFNSSLWMSSRISSDEEGGEQGRV